MSFQIFLFYHTNNPPTKVDTGQTNLNPTAIDVLEVTIVVIGLLYYYMGKHSHFNKHIIFELESQFKKRNK